MTHIPRPIAPHVAGLDTLRIVAAIWVAASHGARLPLQELHDSGAALPNLLALANNALFNGVAAVFVFFTISGFVVHHGNVGAARIDALSFWVRRGIRVGIPLLFIFVLARFLGGAYDDVEKMIFWSIYCELLYYILYPLFFRLFRLLGLRHLVIISLYPAVAVGIFYRHTLYFSELSVLLAAIIGLPAWLAGCALAEDMNRKPNRDATFSLRNVLIYRGVALLLSIGLKFLVTHGPVIVGFPASHWLFGLFCFFWLRAEIVEYAQRAPLKFIEKAGACSYSLYLTHYLVLVFFHTYAAAGDLRVWLAQTACIAAAAYALYILVERPSHRLARFLGQKIKRCRSPKLIVRYSQ